MIKKTLAVAVAVLGFEVLFLSSFSDKLQWSLAIPGTVWFWAIIVIGQISLALAFMPHQINPTALSRRLKLAVASSVIAFIAATLSLYHTSEVDVALLAGISLVSTLLSTYFYALTHDDFGSVTEMSLAPLQVGLSYLGKSLEVIFEYPFTFFSKVSQFSGWKKVRWQPTQEHQVSIFRGVVVTVPIVIVLLALLTAADPIFGKLVENTLHFQITLPVALNIFAMRLAVGVIFAILILPLLLLRIPYKFRSPLAQTNWKNVAIEALMAVATVSAVLAVFLVVQFRYVFATVSETELHQFGVQTFSEYVRKGFSELILVGLLVYGVATFGLLAQRHFRPAAKRWLTGLNTVLIVEGLIFLVSVFRRVFLYQATHGFSRSRIYGISFLCILAVLFSSLLLRLFIRKQIAWYVAEMTLILGVIVITVLMQPDKMIATQYQPTVNSKVDYVYIARLSPEAVDGWVEAYNHAKQVLNNPAFTDKHDYSEDEVREVRYAGQIIFAMQRNYSDLLGYSDLRAKADGWKYQNMAYDEALKVLKEKIPQDELNQLSAKSYTLGDIFAKKRYDVVLDRSYESPLMN